MALYFEEVDLIRRYSLIGPKGNLFVGEMYFKQEETIRLSTELARVSIGEPTVGILKRVARGW